MTGPRSFSPRGYTPAALTERTLGEWFCRWLDHPAVIRVGTRFITCACGRFRKFVQDDEDLDIRGFYAPHPHRRIELKPMLISLGDV